MRYRYRVIERDPHVILLRDDGYRIHGRYIETPLINVDKDEWQLVMEYKHSDAPTMAEAVVGLVMLEKQP